MRSLTWAQAGAATLSVLTIVNPVGTAWAQVQAAGAGAPFSITVEPLNKATVSAGSGPVVAKQQGAAISIGTRGLEDFRDNDGRKSDAQANAAVTGLTNGDGNVGFTLGSTAYARGGHTQNYMSVPFGPPIKAYGADTSASSQATAAAVATILFRKDELYSSFRLFVRTSTSGVAPTITLQEGQGSAHTIDPKAPFVELKGGEGKAYFLSFTLPATASNAGGCCEQKVENSSRINIFLSKTPIASQNFSTPLILNGKETLPDAYQEIVAIVLNLGTGLDLNCTGTVIAPRTILTAAHCIADFQGNIRNHQMFAVAGKFVSQPIEQPIEIVGYDFPQDVKRDGFKYSPDHNYEDDIGLLYLDHPLSTVKSYPTRYGGAPTWATLKAEAAAITVVGYGLAEDPNGHLSDEGVKRYVTMGFQDVTNKTLIYDYAVNKAGACQGDSGGGTYLSQQHSLAAVTSASSDSTCHGKGQQTLIDAYTSWINSRLRN